MRFTGCTINTGWVSENDTMLACTVSSTRDIKEREKRKSFTSATQLSETTCQRCNSMYNILQCMYTFPYQQIWNMSILILMTGIEMITKHPGCFFNKHIRTYVQRKTNIQKTPNYNKFTSPSSNLFFFFTIMCFPFLNA